jgi:hypothetical protein
MVPFPTAHYAEVAMETIGVDPAFSDSKTKKCRISRHQEVLTLDDGSALLVVRLSCPREDAGMLRTCASAFFQNLELICRTMSQFGK